MFAFALFLRYNNIIVIQDIKMLSDTNIHLDDRMKGRGKADEDACMHHQEGLKGRPLFQ